MELEANNRETQIELHVCVCVFPLRWSWLKRPICMCDSKLVLFRMFDWRWYVAFISNHNPLLLHGWPCGLCGHPSTCPSTRGHYDNELGGAACLHKHHLSADWLMDGSSQSDVWAWLMFNVYVMYVQWVCAIVFTDDLMGYLLLL